MVFVRTQTFDFLERQRMIHIVVKIVKVQSLYRTVLACRYLQKCKKSILVIQMSVRRHQLYKRIQFSQHTVAATKMQKIFRGYFHRRSYIFTIQKICRMQSMIRKALARTRYAISLRLFKAARMIQCRYRIRIAKLKVLNKKRLKKDLTFVIAERDSLKSSLVQRDTEHRLEIERSNTINTLLLYSLI